MNKSNLDKTKDENLSVKEKENKEMLVSVADSTAISTVCNFFSFGIYGEVKRFQENKSLNDRLLKIEEKLNKYGYNVENYFYARKLVENYLLSPVTMQDTLLDNFFDIISEYDFDKLKADDFLDFKISEINEISKFFDNIEFRDGIFVVKATNTSIKIINILIHNGYIEPYFGICVIEVSNRKPPYYRITEEGLKFIILFINDYYKRYIDRYNIGYYVLNDNNEKNKDVKEMLLKLKDDEFLFYQELYKLNIM